MCGMLGGTPSSERSGIAPSIPMLRPDMDRLHQSHASEDRQRAVLVTLLSFLSYGLMLGVGIVLGRALGATVYTWPKVHGNWGNGRWID